MVEFAAILLFKVVGYLVKLKKVCALHWILFKFVIKSEISQNYEVSLWF